MPDSVVSIILVCWIRRWLVVKNKGTFDYFCVDTSEAHKTVNPKKLKNLPKGGTILRPTKLKYVSVTSICFCAFKKTL